MSQRFWKSLRRWGEGASAPLLACALTLSCAGSDGGGEGSDAPVAASAWLEELTAAHRALDEAKDESARTIAEARLSALAESGKPGELAGAEWAELRQDIAGRLSEAALQRGAEEQAVRWANRGIGFDTAPSVFRAHLFLLRARAERALGDRERASESLFEALKVNQDLLDQELETP